MNFLVELCQFIFNITDFIKENTSPGYKLPQGPNLKADFYLQSVDNQFGNSACVKS